MSRGKKLDIFIDAEIEDGWAEVASPRKTDVSNEILEPQKHFLFFKKEKRNGKTVTLVGEFHLTQNDAEATLKMLKKRLGCGGTLKEGWMEFQGELKDKLKPLLLENNFRFKHGH
ncbi:MAG: translation initiation factor [Sulfurimonas sp.]|uniref:translation initiation factor n=1 Tax=Sulfurimonas sp. TaxID=2022749 RepID=UPI0026040D9B|nr:translation initiation factor [Sulfurimonas sp.]MDD2652685.1 translation initiation factor [Sulfurimonas sp.]MDD3450852.1 translation initiation factor [Sulfurimonas sp.]